MKTNKLYLPKKFYDKFMEAKYINDAPIYHDSFSDSNVEFVETSTLWHKPSELPNFPCCIILGVDYGEPESVDFSIEIANYNTKENYMGDFALCCNAVAWCYASDIIPKGGVR